MKNKASEFSESSMGKYDLRSKKDILKRKIRKHKEKETLINVATLKISQK